MDRITLKNKRYKRRRISVKKKIKSDAEKLRFCVSKSNKNFFCQIIDDVKKHTLVSASTEEKTFSEMKNRCNIEAAKAIGKIIAERATGKGIKKVVFDRNGYLFHGKIKSLADSARENGLEF